MQIKMKLVIVFGIWVLTLIAGCAPKSTSNLETKVSDTGTKVPEPAQVNPTIFPSKTATVTMQLATETPIIPTTSPTPLPTIEALTSSPIIPTETTPVVSLPILPPDEAANKVMALLANSQDPNCLFPCWWGAKPGETKTIQEIAPIPLERYFPLEEKTALTPQTLYERFSDATQAPCISTSSDLWE